MHKGNLKSVHLYFTTSTAEHIKLLKILALLKAIAVLPLH